MQTLKTNAPTSAPVLPVTKLTMADTLRGVTIQAGLAGMALVDMVASMALTYIVGYYLVPVNRPKKDEISDKIKAALQAGLPAKAKSTLAAYVTTATELYAVMTDGENKAQKVREFKPVIEAIASAKTVEAAQDALVSHLKSKGVTGLDKLKIYVGVAPSNAPATPQTATQKVSTRITDTMKAVGTLVADKEATAAKTASVVANALPATIVGPELLKAVTHRIQDAQVAAIAAKDACLHLAHLDVDAFDVFIVDMTKVRDAMLASKAKTAKATTKTKTKTEHRAHN